MGKQKEDTQESEVPQIDYEPDGELFDLNEPRRETRPLSNKTGKIIRRGADNVLDPSTPESISIDSLTNPVWEMQSQIGETEYYHRAFMIFADLPANERIVLNAYKRFTGKQQSLAISESFARASRDYFWHKRAAALDLHRYEVQRESWVLKDDERRTADFEMGEILRNLSLERLRTVNPSELSLTLAIRFAEVASLLQNNAVPKDMLNRDNIKALLVSLPEDRRRTVIAILIAKLNQ